MRYLALACDYDGTIADQGRVDEPTLAALRRVKDSGRRLVMVTGRELDDLSAVFGHLDLFDRVVAENGALLYNPAARKEQILGERPPAIFAETLRKRGVEPLSVGRAIVATWHPHETAVLHAIEDLGLELQVIFNKGAVMVLPSGVNKATGLAAALRELGLSPRNTVAVGDAENDHAFFSLCEVSAAVANALPLVKERADIVTSGAHGEGVAELIDEMLADEFGSRRPQLLRRQILIGRLRSRERVCIPPLANVLVAGASGGGKSTLATALVERSVHAGYQCLVIDPEGDYDASDHVTSIGTPDHAPAPEEALRLLADPGRSAAIDLLGVDFHDRSDYFIRLLPRVLELRTRTGRPHRLVLEEAHHLVPDSSSSPVHKALTGPISGLLVVTTDPRGVARDLLAQAEYVVGVGNTARDVVGTFCDLVGRTPPPLPTEDLRAREVILWQPDSDSPPTIMRVASPSDTLRRHLRKYAAGELGPERSFYFRGPDGKMNLRAQNLAIFLQLAEGVDEETWLHHLRRGDYSRWLREQIKDRRLARKIEKIETRRSLAPEKSRELIRGAIRERYTMAG